MELTGNAYFEGVTLGNQNSDLVTAPPSELYILRPDRIAVVPGDALIPIAGYEYRAGSVVVPYRVQMWRNPKTGGFTPRVPIMHSKYWNPLVEEGDWYGLSPIRAASRNIDAFNSAVSWNVGLTQNTARPSGIFTTEDPTLDAVRAEEYTNLIRQKFSGAGNAGRPMVLGKGLTWQQLGLSPVDMDWLEGLEWNQTQICAIFGIPPEIIGDSAHRTYSNFEEARKSVWMEKWLNMLDMLRDDLNRWLSPLFYEEYGDEIFLDYDRDAIEAIQEDRQIKWKNAKDGTGFLRVNEQRALLGYDPIPDEEGGECVLVPVGMVPLKVSGNQEEMPSIALANTAAEHQQDTQRQQARQQQNQAQPTAPGKKPTRKPKPAGKKPAGKKKPAKKSFDYADESIIDADFEDVPDSVDALLKQIQDTRERLRLLTDGS